MESVYSLTSKLDLDDVLLKYYQELSEVINSNRGRDLKKISKISKKIYTSGLTDIVKIPFDPEFHQKVITELKNENIGLIIKIGKNINPQQIKRFNAKNISVESMEIYKDTDIAKIYINMLDIFDKMEKYNILFVCDDGKTYGVYVITLYFLYISYMTKINRFDRLALLEIVDVNKFLAPKILEFIMITKKDVMENRRYVEHMFYFEMNLKFYITEKVYQAMLAEKYNIENIDYSEITTYRVLINNVKAYLKKKQSIDTDTEVKEKPEIKENPETSEILETKENPEISEILETKEIPEILETKEIPEILEIQDVMEIGDVTDIHQDEKNKKDKENKNTAKHKQPTINLDIKYPKNKDTDLSIINYLFQ